MKKISIGYQEYDELITKELFYIDKTRFIKEWWESGDKVTLIAYEYDTPMQESYVNGYWEDLTSYTRNLFNAAFKSNPFLERAIMTGITRISKESSYVI